MQSVDKFGRWKSLVLRKYECSWKHSPLLPIQAHLLLLHDCLSQFFTNLRDGEPPWKGRQHRKAGERAKWGNESDRNGSERIGSDLAEEDRQPPRPNVNNTTPSLLEGNLPRWCVNDYPIRAHFDQRGWERRGKRANSRSALVDAIIKGRRLGFLTYRRDDR
jgi:hypothetical protein